MENFNFDTTVGNAINKAIKELGHVNIIITGGTGVGKSTLINAVFQGDLAQTGHGRPITKNTREIKKEGVPLSIFDTRGLEMADYDETLNQLSSTVDHKAKDTNPNNHIHVAWVCISEDSRRVQPAEEKLVEALAERMPVIAVITKSRADNGFRAEVQRILPKVTNVINVRAIRETLDEEDGILLPKGLDKLVDLTMQVLPEGRKRAFVAAQKVDIEQKQEHSLKIVAGSATSAAAMAIIPIPFCELVAIVPIQIAMLAGISATFGLSFNESFFNSMLGGIITGGGGVITQQSIVSGIIKFIPGVGSVAGAAISSSTALAVTFAFGRAYTDTLVILFEQNNRLPTKEEIISTFKQQYKNPEMLKSSN